LRGILAVAVVLALGVVAFGPASFTGAHPSETPVTASASAIPLAVNWTQPTSDLSAGFWGADVRPYTAIGTTQAAWWAQTPLGYARWPGGAVGDGYNYTSSVITNTGGGTYQSPQSTSQFVAWCRSVSCHAIMQVPAEVDQPGMGAYYVKYVEKTLGFHPDFWEIGNEPALWQELGVPWVNWGHVSGKSSTPAVYAQIVHAYISAIRTVDPSARFVGLPGTGIGASQETTWLGDTVAVNGPNLSAVAIHVYPAGTGSGSATLPGFFGSLYGKGSLGTRVPADRAAVRAACPKCGPIAMFVTELNAGISGGIWDTYMATYPEVPFMAAQLLQAIQVGVNNLDIFAFQSSYPGSLFDGSGVAQPVDALYASVLSHMGTLAVPTELPTSEQGAYAQVALSSDGSMATLVLANANASTTLTVSLSGSGFPTAGPVGLWAWNDSNRAPSSWTAPSVPSTLTVPAASVLLVRVPHSSSPPPPTYPVKFTEAGLPSGSPWSVSVAGTVYDSVTSSAIANLVNGTYSFSVTGPSYWTASPANGSVTVAGSSVTRSIQFAYSAPPPPQYPVRFTPTGSPAAGPWSVTLGNSTQAGNGTLAFSEVNGTYPYSVTPPAGMTATPASGSLTVAGTGVTRSIQLAGNGTSPTQYPVQFEPTGTPLNGPWTVTLGNAKESGNGTLSFADPNGTYVFSVTPPTGLTATPANGSVTLAGAGATRSVQFGSTVTSPSHYSVYFEPTGGSSNGPWSVTLGNSSRSGNGTLAFSEVNGSYAFSVTAPPGETATPAQGTANVVGADLTIGVTLGSPTGSTPRYTVSFVGSGLPAGKSWKVTLGSVVVTGVGNLEFVTTNGSYAFQVSPPTGYAGVPTTGTVVVAGANLTIGIRFTPSPGPPPPKGPPTYPVQFAAHGLPSNMVWSVAVTNATANSTQGDQVVIFDLANGTYDYSLSEVPGFVPAVPSGTVVVAGCGWMLNVSYEPATTVPTPPGSALGALSSAPGSVTQSWLFLALLGVVASGAVYGFERGLNAVRSRVGP